MTYLVIGLLVEAASAFLFLYLWRNEQDKTRSLRQLATERAEQLARQAEKFAAERVMLEDKAKRLESVIAGLDSRTSDLVKIIVDNGGGGLAELGSRVLQNPYNLDHTAGADVQIEPAPELDPGRGKR